MPRTIDEWQSRIKTVESEFKSARLAVDRLLADASRDHAILKPMISLSDVRQASERLEGTYIVRLFAEFETGLRQFWRTARRSDTPSRTRDLLDGIAASRQIPNDQRINAHKVRTRRNNLIHERDEQSAPISLVDARGYLCYFLSFLPPNW